MSRHLTGWVAANLQTVVNSDPALDLGDVARSFEPRLQSCLSTPMNPPDGLVGVLTLYSGKKDAFSDDHRRIVELVAGQVADRVRQTIKSETIRAEGHSRSGPEHAELDQIAGAFENRRHLGFAGKGFSLLLITLVSSAERGQTPGNQLKSPRAIESLRASLRNSDLLFQDGDECVALLPEADDQACQVVADKLRASYIADTVLIGGATSPADGSTLNELLSVARSRLRSATGWSQEPTGPTPLVH